MDNIVKTIFAFNIPKEFLVHTKEEYLNWLMGQSIQSFVQHAKIKQLLGGMWMTV